MRSSTTLRSIACPPLEDDRLAPPDPERRLTQLRRSRGALRWAIARLAAALVGRPGRCTAASGPDVGPRWDRLGYARAADYARERLGVSPRSLQDWARVGRALAERPRLEAALVSGALSWSKARMLARFVGPQDEAAWIDTARRCTARELERRARAVDRDALAADARAARTGQAIAGHGDASSIATPDCDEDGYGTEPLETAELRVGMTLAFRWQRTRRWASRVAGEPVSPGTALEMVTAEAFSALPPAARVAPADEALPPAALAAVPAQLGAPDAADVCAGHGARGHPVPDAGAAGARDAPAARAGAVEVANVCAAQGAVEHEPAAMRPAVGAVAFLRPLVEGIDEADLFELDSRLRRAMRLERRLDAEIAALLRRVTAPGYDWRNGRPTRAAFARERLGMSPRKARALLRIERAALACPALGRAWRDGALSWVQAQILLPLLV
ncbi:MAG TPA: hypothetical protein VKB65_02910, partial [Myxococcota bacterium]|nr:hypothetical protein [Myxococcota bacterium]